MTVFKTLDIKATKQAMKSGTRGMGHKCGKRYDGHNLQP